MGLNTHPGDVTSHRRHPALIFNLNATPDAAPPFPASVTTIAAILRLRLSKSPVFRPIFSLAGLRIVAQELSRWVDRIALNQPPRPPNSPIASGVNRLQESTRQSSTSAGTRGVAPAWVQTKLASRAARACNRSRSSSCNRPQTIAAVNASPAPTVSAIAETGYPG